MEQVVKNGGLRLTPNLNPFSGGRAGISHATSPNKMMMRCHITLAWCHLPNLHVQLRGRIIAAGASPELWKHFFPHIFILPTSSKELIVVSISPRILESSGQPDLDLVWFSRTFYDLGVLLLYTQISRLAWYFLPCLILIIWKIKIGLQYTGVLNFKKGDASY